MNPKEALTAAKNGQTKAAQDACLYALDSPDAPAEQWSPVFEEILKNSETGSNEELGWAGLDALEARLDARALLPHARRILRFFSKNDEFRGRAVEMYLKAFENTEGLEELLEISGLRGGKPIRRAMQTLDICLDIEPGRFLVHKDEGPPAKVVEIDKSTWSVRLQTPNAEELLDPVSLGDHYEVAEAHDFRVLSRFDPDAFKKQLQNDPADIVVTILRARGGQMTSDQLESMLSPRYIASGAWSKWWTKVRAGLRKNARVLLEGRNPVTISYQEHDIPIEDTVWGKFDVHQAPKAWLDLAQEYIRECRDKNVDAKPEFLRRLRDAVRVEAQALEDRKEQPALAGWLTCTALSRMIDEPPDHEAAFRVMEKFGAYSEAVSHLPNDTYVGLALEVIRDRRTEDWPQDFVELLPYINPGRSDDLVKQVREAGQDDMLRDIPQKILSDPVAHASGLCWLFQGPKDTELFEIPPLVTLLTRLLSALEHMRSVPPEFAREIKSRARGVLTARKFGRFQACLEQIDEGMASALRTQLQRSTALTDAVIQDLTNKVRGSFSQLWTQPRKRRWEDESVLFCTAAGRYQKEADLHELVTVKMKENAKAIGDAAAHGDLSENSEYKFALEERDLLQARMAEIQNQLARAQTLESDDIPIEYAGVGSRVTLEAESGDQTITLTFLGPWEADVDKHILNYQAPLSQGIMGRTLGDAVTIDLGDVSGTFRISAIEAGL